MNTVLVTGGAGYIGSHTVLLLLEAGRRVLVLDNLSNSSRESLERVAAITGKRAEFVEGDIRDTALLDRLFQEHRIGSVIHFAGLKAVGESVAQPLRYYDCNVTGSLRLLEAMDRAGVHHLVFSSSATVYGDPASVPIREDFPLSATNPYGATKLHIEDMLRDLHRADPPLVGGVAALFQPGGRPRKRPHRRRPQRGAQQPDALRGAGGGGQAGTATGVRRRLRHPGRYRGARLHPRHGSGGRPSGGAGRPGPGTVA